MRWKSPSTTVTLVFGCAAIAAALAVGCSVRENGGKQSSRCIRIHAHAAAVFADDGRWFATLSNIGSTWGARLNASQTILVCDADDGHELLKLDKSGQVFFELFTVSGQDELISLSVDAQLDPRSQLELTYWDFKTGRKLNSATVDPDLRLRGENRFVLSPGGERLYLISELSPVQRKRMPTQLQSAGTLTCWELPTARKQFEIRDDAAPQPRLSSLVFTGDGSIMAAICEPRKIAAWDAVTGRELHVHRSRCPAIGG
jgi:hypothetical protein